VVVSSPTGDELLQIDHRGSLSECGLYRSLLSERSLLVGMWEHLQGQKMLPRTFGQGLDHCVVFPCAGLLVAALLTTEPTARLELKRARLVAFELSCCLDGFAAWDSGRHG
jgi:hypothetical protein